MQKARVGDGELLEGVEDVAAEEGDGKVGDGARLDHEAFDGGVQGGCLGQMREMEWVGILMVNKGLVGGR